MLPLCGNSADVANQIQRAIDPGQFPSLATAQNFGFGCCLRVGLAQSDRGRPAPKNFARKIGRKDAQHSIHQEELPCYAMVSSFWRLLYWFVPVLFPMMRWLAVGEAADGEVASTLGVLVAADFTLRTSAVVRFMPDASMVDVGIASQEVLGRPIP